MHLKRLPASKNFPIARKAETFTTAPRAGPHAKDECIPLGIVIRDMLNVVETAKEAKKVLKQGKVLVDEKPRKDHKYPIGYMDVIKIPDLKKMYRVIYTAGKLKLKETDWKAAETKGKTKLCKITVKKHIKGGKIQLGLHDGRTILLDKKDKDKYKVGDSLLITLPDQKIKDAFVLKDGNTATVIKGQHKGKVGKIKEISIRNDPLPNTVVLDVDGSEVRTLKDNLFVVGKDKPIMRVKI